MTLLRNLFKKIPKKFLIIGFINTVFGYSIGLVNYFLLIELVGIIAVGIINNVASITFSFFMFKKFVFKTTNTNWILEYFRSYLVYLIKGIVGILTLWFFIEILKMNIYISQAISMLVTIFLSYKGHKNFTFRVNKVE